MPKLAVRRPFAEIDVRNKVWPDEMRAPPCVGRKSSERRRFHLPLLQLLEKRSRFGLGKAGAHLACEAQIITFEVTHQQCAKSPRVFRLFGVTSDNQLLFFDAFGF